MVHTTKKKSLLRINEQEMNRKTVFQELRVNQLMKYSFFILFKRRMVLTFLLGFWQIVDRKEQLRYI